MGMWTRIQGQAIDCFEQMSGDDFYVSYLRIGKVEETVLVRDGEKAGYALDGDWRTEYERMLSLGFDGCHYLYLQQKLENENVPLSNEVH